MHWSTPKITDNKTVKSGPQTTTITATCQLTPLFYNFVVELGYLIYCHFLHKVQIIGYAYLHLNCYLEIVIAIFLDPA